MAPEARPTRSVLFDWEGTLADFQWRLAEAEAELRSALAGLGFGLEEFSADNYATLRTRALERRPDLEAEVDRAFSAVYDRYDADALSRWSLRPGARELPSRLRAGGMKVALVSNIGRRALGPALRRLGLEGAFDLVVSRNDVRLMKPSGEGIRKALAAFECAPENALFVGDSLSDLFAARDAGVRVAIVAGGETPSHRVREHRPDFHPDDLAGVEALLAR